MIPWIQFLALAAVILVAGSRLSKYGDVIAEKTGMGGTWVGIILMASVTSLPELITGASSVVLFDLPDLAVGNVLGACMFNMLTIALLDALSGRSPISASVHQGQGIGAAFGVLMLGAVAIAISVSAGLPPIGWIGWYSLVFITIYVAAMRTVYLFERRRSAEPVHERVEAEKYGSMPLRKAYRNYVINAAFVIAAAVYLPHVGDRIAEATGLGGTFVGTTFIALTTTLPELVVSISALRIGAADLIFGNLFGSNLFNLAILAVNDILYLKGPLLSHVSQIHGITANAAMAMTAAAVIGLTYRASRKRFLFAWDSLAIVAIYALGVGTMFSLR